LASTRRYLELRLQDFLEDVASADLAPGAGLVAAIAVAMGAGLVAMAARLSRDEWLEAQGSAAQAEALRSRVTPLAELNAEAYASAVAALRLEDASDPTRRDEAIAIALERAAEIPLQIGEVASDVASLAAEVAEHGEPNLRADVAIAALLSEAGAKAAATLVEINLGTTSDDERVARARQLVTEASAACEKALAVVA
jgi:glutamate formiminotransferase/formiminotetrahydrofolate cyclodeaminase